MSGTTCTRCGASLMNSPCCGFLAATQEESLRNKHLADINRKLGKELHDTGLLFEVNRVVMHKFGIALQVTVEDSGDIWLSGMMRTKAIEGFEFGEELLEEGTKKLHAFEEASSKRLQTRQEVFGFMVQPLPGEEG